MLHLTLTIWQQLEYILPTLHVERATTLIIFSNVRKKYDFHENVLNFILNFNNNEHSVLYNLKKTHLNMFFTCIWTQRLSTSSQIRQSLLIQHFGLNFLSSLLKLHTDGS